MKQKLLLSVDLDKIELPQILKSLSDPTRLSIVATLYSNNKECSCAIFEHLGKKSNLSQHYRNLRLNGLISVRRSGIHSYLNLRKKELNQKFPGLLENICRNWKHNNNSI
ncbi:MAG: helix-turn-helix transcriptional regulator [Liquorilactobacillus ghanensis]|jgi:DNA-binding transcriptional ArsR family regulator|uniref:HTH arsR-type domain-containing protein n=1 Tax=Liquorilactobacillus ghanensis DSM 18630 TaxID=1423750 RepID=A0A0R1VHR1_9LACO|nr:helix-turn-helix transcriptional regulator [Liquorilactobacillus ghanensis]KRM05312.1 hypothetical protein FC89_GL001783 [Liquorilactobacillus ghanensis DSM 18630]